MNAAAARAPVAVAVATCPADGGGHCLEGEYAGILTTLKIDGAYRRQRLAARRRFVAAYPDLTDWFDEPLARRVGRLPASSAARCPTARPTTPAATCCSSGSPAMPGLTTRGCWPAGTSMSASSPRRSGSSSACNASSRTPSGSGSSAVEPSRGCAGRWAGSSCTRVARRPRRSPTSTSTSCWRRSGAFMTTATATSSTARASATAAARRAGRRTSTCSRSSSITAGSSRCNRAS